MPTAIRYNASVAADSPMRITAASQGKRLPLLAVIVV
jgi:hypothetical protein